MLDVEPCGFSDSIEQRRLGCGHPYLRRTVQSFEQGGSASRVEVGRHLVEEEDRSVSTMVCDQFRMGKHKPKQQSLLLAGRRLGGGHALCAVENLEVLPVRPFHSAPSGSIA